MSPGGRARRAVDLLLPAAYMALIYLQSSHALPDAGIDLPPLTDKLLHAAGYAVLGALLARAAVLGLGWPPWSWPAAALGSALYGITDEIHQRAVPGRTASALDWVADAAGSVAGAWLLVRWQRRRALSPRASPGAT